VLALDMQMKGVYTEFQWLSKPLMVPLDRSQCFISKKSHSFFSKLVYCHGCGNAYDPQYCNQTYSFPHLNPQKKDKKYPCCLICYEDFRISETLDEHWLQTVLNGYPGYDAKRPLIGYIYHQQVQKERISQMKYQQFFERPLYNTEDDNYSQQLMKMCASRQIEQVIRILD